MESKRNPVLKTYVVRDIEEYVEKIYKCHEDYAQFGNEYLWYRGHRSVRWKLRPLIFRNDKTSRASKRLWERGLFLKFRAGAGPRKDKLPLYESLSEWLCLMRHYNLATRLLDWSTSPLVALHFALNETPTQTPCVWVLNSFDLNVLQTRRHGIIMMRDDTVVEELKPLIKGSVDPSINTSVVLAVVPPEVDPRMMVQCSRFTIHGNENELALMKLNKPYLIRIRIERTQAATMRRALTMLGITDTGLFPDLDHLAKSLLTNIS